MSDSYDVFAEVYDAWQRVHGPVYSDLIAPDVDQRLKGRIGNPNRLIDLACGTGTHAIRLARAGVRVIGVDRSEAMVRQARAKARQAGVSVDFVRADMRTFNVERSADAVTCLYASMNHLPAVRDLESVFGRVRAHLRPGGALVFDVNTRAGFEALWRMPATDRGPGLVVHRTYEVEDEIWTTMRLAIEHERDGTARPASATLRARWFADDEIRGALNAAGLDTIEVAAFNPFPEVDAAGIKQLWTASRPVAG